MAEIFLEPPMRNYGIASLHDCVAMGTAGALAIRVVVVTGGRVVQATYDKITKNPQLLLDADGNLLDFPTDQMQTTQTTQQRPTQDYNVTDDRPTTPRPAQSSVEGLAEQHALVDRVDDAMSGSIKSLEAAKSKSPDTPVAVLFQAANDDNIWTLQMSDEQTKRDRERALGMGNGLPKRERIRRR